MSWHQRAGSKSYYINVCRGTSESRADNQKKSNGRKRLKLPSLATQSVWSRLEKMKKKKKQKRLFFWNLCKLKVVTLLEKVHFLTLTRLNSNGDRGKEGGREVGKEVVDWSKRVAQGQQGLWSFDLEPGIGPAAKLVICIMNDTPNSIVCQGNLSKFGNLLPTALDYFQTHTQILTHIYGHTHSHTVHREVEQHTVRRWLMVPLKRPYQDGPPNRLRTKKQNQRRGHLVPLYHLPLPTISRLAW